MPQDLVPTLSSPAPAATPSRAQPPSTQVALARLDRVAKLMDAQFKLPVLGTKVGLDPILGLAPGAGDWITGAVSIYLLWQASRLGAPPMLLVRMAGNVGLDILGGYIPVAGDLFDLAYKANTRNMKLLRDHLDPLGQATPGTMTRQNGGDLLVQERPSAARQIGTMVVLTLVLALLASGPVVLLYLLLRG